MSRIKLVSLYRGHLRKNLRSFSSTSSSQSTNETHQKVKVLYDGDCSLCAQEMKVVRYLNKNKNIVELVDITKPGYNPAEYNNITFEEAMAEFHVIDQNNKVHKRIPAMHTMYSSLGHGWSTFYTKWPILAPLFDKAYGKKKKNRLRWTKREDVMENHPNMTPGNQKS
ncbi:uncharacterized protein [Amphiura filiformis]|uniref:uncharacterized protein n=1 Tax=Amphiura filiformis TaxID=82378 RepID=UPI003B214E65